MDNISTDQQVQTAQTNLTQDNNQVEVTNDTINTDVTQTQDNINSEENKQTGDENINKQDIQVEAPSSISQEEAEQLKAKLQEYQLTDAELNQLKQRIGVNEVDYNTAQIQNTIGLIQNQAQQEYIALCNQYGIDSRPDRIDISAKELEEKDPKSFYAFQRKLDNLYTRLNSQISEVKHYSVSRDVNNFYNENKMILEASPTINSVINQYLTNTPAEYINRQDLDSYLTMARQIYTEAYNVGLQMAQQQQKLSPNKILNNSVMSSQQTTYPVGSSTFTRDQIQNMSLEDFSKHEQEIMNQMVNGQIR